jgi:hypothetical protein
MFLDDDEVVVDILTVTCNKDLYPPLNNCLVIDANLNHQFTCLHLSSGSEIPKDYYFQ